MKVNACVILAAGRNSRLDTGIPKSLLRVGELPLIERQITIFKELGISQFCVVVGYQKEKLSKELRQIASQHDIDIEIVANANWELENGYSLYCAKDWVNNREIEAFYFTMADHYFSLPFLKDVTENMYFIDDNNLQLVVDQPSHHNTHIDIEDVTRVLVNNYRIVNIGKLIAEYNYYDTGLFCAKPVIFITLQQLVKEGKCSISKMVNQLCHRNEAGVTLVGRYFWNDIDNEHDLKTTLELLNENNRSGID